MSTPSPDHTKLECPRCGQHLEVPNQLAGSKVECPTCAQAVPFLPHHAPEPDSLTAPPTADPQPPDTAPPAATRPLVDQRRAFQCEECGQQIVIVAATTVASVRCPNCLAASLVPKTSSSPPPAGAPPSGRPEQPVLAPVRSGPAGAEHLLAEEVKGKPSGEFLKAAAPSPPLALETPTPDSVASPGPGGVGRNPLRVAQLVLGCVLGAVLLFGGVLMFKPGPPDKAASLKTVLQRLTGIHLWEAAAELREIVPNFKDRGGGSNRIEQLTFDLRKAESMPSAFLASVHYRLRGPAGEPAEEVELALAYEGNKWILRDLRARGKDGQETVSISARERTLWHSHLKYWEWFMTGAIPKDWDPASD